MTKKNNIKRKTKKKTSNKKSKEVVKDKSIIWAVILGVALAAGVIWYLIRE